MISTSKVGLEVHKTFDLAEGGCVLEWKTNVVNEKPLIVFPCKERIIKNRTEVFKLSMH